MLSESNWNTTIYQNQSLRALISTGCDYVGDELKINYFASVIDENNIDLIQKTFTNLDDACSYLNYMYHNVWEFSELDAKKGSGCDSCVAH